LALSLSKISLFFELITGISIVHTIGIPVVYSFKLDESSNF
jgi:hypothetical protein